MTSTALSRPGVDKTLSPVDQAYQHVLQAILAGDLLPGMRVPAEAVAEALGISRMPVRDALRRLEGDGVVIIFPNRGAAVAEYTRDEVAQLIQMRAVLEGLAARLAIPHVTAEGIAELRHRKLQMERSSDDLAKWMAHHDGFHNYLTSLSGLTLLMKQTERMRLMLNPYYRRYYEQSREFEIQGLEHQKIVDTIEYKDGNHLEQIVRGHALVNVEKIASFA